MANVSNLTIKVQPETIDTMYATWEFDEYSPVGSTAAAANGTSSGSGSVKVGDLVSISSDAKYYNGTSIPSWVKSQKWYVSHVSGDRAVLGKNQDGSNNIQSPINVKYLTGGTGSGSGSGSGSTQNKIHTLEHYAVKWEYTVEGSNTWFSGGESTTKYKNATYNPPSNASSIRVFVTPVAKTYTVDDKEVSYWTGYSRGATYNMNVAYPEKPSVPKVTIDGFTLTAVVDNISDPRTTHIVFDIYDGDTPYRSWVLVKVVACRAKFECTVQDGGKYRARCRAVNEISKDIAYKSDWTDFSDESISVPTQVSGITAVATTTSSVKVSWSKIDSATSYEVQYTTDKSYFDTSSEVKSTTVNGTVAMITGLEADEWFFRVRAVNSSGNSSWSEIVSTAIGTKPEAPTTWSLTTTAIVGEKIILYWVHNSEDKSNMSEATIEIDINGYIDTVVITPSGTEEVYQDAIQSYEFTPTGYSEGATIKWRVKTKGIVPEYGDWSVRRTINLYAQPSVAFSINTDSDGVIRSLPIHLTVSSGPSTQMPLNYHVSIVSNSNYESEDDLGSQLFISAGNEVYSKVLDTTANSFSYDISAGDLRLESGQNYTITITVAMNSGLTASSSQNFTVSWDDYEFLPDASITIDNESLSAYINPFAWNSDGTLAENVTLSVYRREYNGSFTLIEKGVANDRIVTVVDPHPSLDYARYRIVAQSTITGDVSYADIPGYPVGEKAIVIQWNEKWSNFEYSYEEFMEDRPWTGSMLKLPYNVDINEMNDPDISLIEYIGRKHPVSYYGTQRGESASWSAEIDKKDKETIYALRRLSAWAGDVYVREPSGLGYWAHIKVTMPIKHLDVIIPVTLDITRVEGDI